MSTTAATASWIDSARSLLDRIASTQDETLDRASEICAGAIGAGGLVHMFGSGHSRIAVEEMFPRYGSYPGFHPIVELSMTFHTQVVGANGQRQAMFIERIEGLGQRILENFELRAPDAMMVFSASGLGAVVIDVARTARERGLPVIAVTSLAQTEAAESSHSSGTRLRDNADLVIDLGTPPADAAISIDGLETPVGPGSTIAGVAIANEIKVRTARLLHAAGTLPPVLTSASVVGEARSRELFEAAYDEHARRLAGVLRGATRPEERGA